MKRLALVLAAGTFLIAPAAAHAATLINSGGTLTYTAAAGGESRLSVSSNTSNDTVSVSREVGGMGAGVNDTDPITQTGCTESGGPGGARYECPNVAQFVADAGDLDDEVLAEGPTTVDLNGGDGEDVLVGGEGDDTIDGGGGDDAVYGGRAHGAEDGADVLRGGPGIDSTEYASWSQPPQTARDVSVTPDGQANDGLAGENDNVTEVEDVSASACDADPFGPPFNCVSPRHVTLVGDAENNNLTVGPGTADIDGGPGSDELTGGENDDTLRARDGFSDRVICGRGDDTAIVDQFDQVSPTCESVQLGAVGNVTDDAPPTVSFASPARGAKLASAAHTTLAASASDDKGVAKVRFLDDDRIVCEDSSTPYTCAYQPHGGDVGRNTLVAVAIDTAQQTANAVRAVTVDRFASKLSLKVRPGKDTRRPFSFTATGRLTPPKSVSRTLGCRGSVAVQARAGRKIISSRRARVTKTCTFSQRLRFRSRKRFGRRGRLRFTARYSGSDVLTPSKSKSKKTRTT